VIARASRPVASPIKDPFTDARSRFLAGRFGVSVFIVSLAVLFVATVIGLVVVRVQLGREGTWPEDLPGLPWTLVVSTLVLIVSSGTMHRAVTAVRGSDDARGTVRRRLAATTALGLLFLLLQLGSWIAWLEPVRERWSASEEWRLALTGFYVLTGLHAVHVVGGIAALVRAARFDGPADALRERVEFSAMYWHFLGIVWLGVYGLLAIWT
jgi:cytochrome c oxidase subunit 3